jgi:hypothetical protein
MITAPSGAGELNTDNVTTSSEVSRYNATNRNPHPNCWLFILGGLGYLPFNPNPYITHNKKSTWPKRPSA